MRVALLGGGTIARLVLEHCPLGIEIVALAGRKVETPGGGNRGGIARGSARAPGAAEAAAAGAGALSYVPSGGIGGLDALRTACLAGVDEVFADPGLTLNTHTIHVSGAAGRMTLVLENVPAPENSKTSWLACYSAHAALGSLQSRVRYGT